MNSSHLTFNHPLEELEWLAQQNDVPLQDRITTLAWLMAANSSAHTHYGRISNKTRKRIQRDTVKRQSSPEFLSRQALFRRLCAENRACEKNDVALE